MAKGQQFPNPEGTFPFFSLMYINVTQRELFGLRLTDHKHINHSMQNDIKINKSDIVVVIYVYIKLSCMRVEYFIFFTCSIVFCANMYLHLKTP